MLCPTQNGVVFGNGKAANAGGVAVSGLEMSQNRIGAWEHFGMLSGRVMRQLACGSTAPGSPCLLRCHALPCVQACSGAARSAKRS